MIPDNNSSGVCVDVTIPVTGTVDNIALALGLDHTYLGDVRAQLISPNQMTLTLMDRPGQPAARYGDTSNLVSAFPITFADDAPNDSEQMGQQLGGNGIVCRDDLRCRYRPNADGTPNTQPSSLHDLAGQNSAGVWRVCVSDLSAKDVGRLHQVTLDLTCSAPQAATPDTLPTPQPIATTVGPASTLTPEPTATAADDPGEGMLKAEELDELAPNVVWLPALTR